MPAATARVTYVPCGCQRRLLNPQLQVLISSLSDGEAEELHNLQEPNFVSGHDLLPTRLCPCAIGEICDKPEQLESRLLNVA